jgi:uncharacterized membrane protein required for colicin V production
MTWLDVVALLLIALIGWLESIRGFGRAIFDFVGCLIAVKISTFAAKPLAVAVPLLQPESHAEAFWMAMVFLLLAVLIIIATKYIYETTLMSLDVLDPLVGAVLGVASGIVVAHMFLRILLTAYAETDFANVVLNSFVGQEIVAFRTFRHVVTALQNIGNW